MRNNIQLDDYVIITSQEIIDNFRYNPLFYGARLSPTFY